jgi:hypothetical protein
MNRLRELKRMFRNPQLALETSEYLGAGRRRGNPGVLMSTLEIDTYMSEILRLYPQGTIDFYRVTLAQIRGFDAPNFSLEVINDSIFRCRATRKKNTFYHGLQDPEKIVWFLQRIRDVSPLDFVNFDQCSCSSEKIRPTYGRGEGRVVVREWKVNTYQFVAMAALTPLGFVRCTKIKPGAFTHEDVEDFLHDLESFLTVNSVALFDNASIQTVDSTLRLIDRIFNQQWIKNVEYCPQLAPVERGFSLVWSYVRRRWLDAQRNPLQVLRDAFDYYSVGGDGATACYNLFNLYFENRNIVMN